MNRNQKALLAAIALTLSGAALASEPVEKAAPAPKTADARKSDEAAPSPDTYPAPIKMAVAGGLKVEKKFSAEGGMTGWLLSQGVGQHVVVFTTADAKIAIAGNMLDSQGRNLTKLYMEEHAPEPDYGPMWEALEKSTYVVEGPKKSENIIYVFKDSNCSFCHLAWKALQPYKEAGLQIRWVPVAFLAEDSMGKAAGLIGAKNADEHLAKLHKKWGAKDPSLTVKANPDIQEKVEANGKLMNEWGFRGTPATIYKDKSGKVQVVSGMFTLSQLPEITGLPEQPNNDPALARFK